MNPYEPPHQQNQVYDHNFEFDEEELVITQRTALPNICVLTGLPLDPEDCSSSTLYGTIWSPINSKSCELFYGITPENRLRYEQRAMLIRLFKLAMVVSFGLAFWFHGWTIPRSWIPFASIFAIFLNLILSGIPTQPLSIARRRGSKFWIKGITSDGRQAIQAHVEKMKLATPGNSDVHRSE